MEKDRLRKWLPDVLRCIALGALIIDIPALVNMPKLWVPAVVILALGGLTWSVADIRDVRRTP